MSKDVFFNELSAPSGDVLSYEEIKSLKGLFLSLHNIPKVDLVCRIDSHLLSSMVESSTAQSYGREVAGFLYSILHPPFEGDSSEDAQAAYMDARWACNDEACFGLAMACILDTLAVSIDRTPWNVSNLQISKNASSVMVRNCSRAEHLEIHSQWLSSLAGIELVACDIPPENKPLKLRDDHGKDVLQAFARRLLRSRYVVEIVNSLEFHPKSRRFIKCCTPDGVVELILNWTDAGYGLAVQTTGRNLLETEEIARRIEADFGHVT